MQNGVTPTDTLVLTLLRQQCAQSDALIQFTKGCADEETTPTPHAESGLQDETYQAALAYSHWVTAYKIKWKHPPTPMAIVKYFQDALIPQP